MGSTIHARPSLVGHASGNKNYPKWAEARDT